MGRIEYEFRSADGASAGRIHTEHWFERHISSHLGGGWRVSADDRGFDPRTALYMPDFVEFLGAVAPDKLEKFKREKGSGWQRALEKALVRELERRGTVQVLRKGFKMAGYQTVACMAPYPEDPRISHARADYDANVLRFMHQVHYQTAGSKSLDAAMFINGIPVATMEVKTELTQTVQDAMDEYRDERKPVEPDTGRKNPLLMYGRGAVVHFAVSEDEVWMTTDLGDGSRKDFAPRFLPFNMGDAGHAGNPPAPEGEYRTHYLWDYILERDNWLSIFESFVFEERESKPDASGRLREARTQIFPRFHQFDSVRRIVADTREKGPGQRYLVEHSPGSGKTETMSWLAHALTRLRAADGGKVFSSVVIVTDRLSLDRNIKGTVTQLSEVAGQVVCVGREADGSIAPGGSKSAQLARAISEGREIVVVTIQTFLWAWADIAAPGGLDGASFAVVIDEAHSSQDGDNASALRRALAMASDGERRRAALSLGDDLTDEEMLNEYFRAVQNAPAAPGNISFYAFTATPKAETKTLFGTPTGEVDEKGNPVMGSFHLYPMRQAIEEGYIVDPLGGYVPYRTVATLEDAVGSDALVDERAARRKIARWKSLHPTNVMSKVEIIVEHFVKNVASLLDGQAKAMIVTDSRPSVVRYKYAFDAYVRAHPELDASKVSRALQFKVPGEPLVAFSDKVAGSKCVVDEDEYLEDNPFALIDRDCEYTESSMNPRGCGSVECAFDRPERRFLIVANKFQTGFDQKKLVALYIDKPLGNDIEIVQTYSRVNRTYPGKDRVFVVDFVNDPERVLSAFRVYDAGAEMPRAQDPDVAYQIKEQLDGAGVYGADEVEGYRRALYASLASPDPDGRWRAALYGAVDGPADRFRSQLAAARDAYATWADVQRGALADGDEETARLAAARAEEAAEQVAGLRDFRRKLGRFGSAYTLVTQMVELDDPELEVFHGFAKLLLERISHTPIDDVDISGLVLADYRVVAQKTPEAAAPAPLEPMGAGARLAAAPRRETLSKIVESLNRTWGDEGDPVVMARAVNYVADRVSADASVRTQVRNTGNSREAVVREGRLKKLVLMALLSISENELADLADQAIGDPQAVDALVDQVFDMVRSGERYDIGELEEFARGVE